MKLRYRIWQFERDTCLSGNGLIAPVKSTERFETTGRGKFLHYRIGCLLLVKNSTAWHCLVYCWLPSWRFQLFNL